MIQRALEQFLKYKKIFFFAFFLPGFLLASLPLSYAAGDNATGSTSGWLTFRGNPEHTGKTSLIGPPEEIEMKWRWRVNYDASPISASPAVTADNTIYSATEGGYFAAISTAGGNSWIYKAAGSVKSSPAVDISGSMFCITADGYAYYLDAKGELAWKSDFAVGISSSPVISGGTAYVGTDDNSLIAINLAPDISRLPDESRLVPEFDVVSWTFPAKGTVTSSPAFSGDTVFFGGGNYVYAINPADAAAGASGGTDNATSMVKWLYDVHNPISSSPAVYNGAVYIGADDGYLYALKENVTGRSTQGELIWKRKTDGSISSSPAVDTPASGETSKEAVIYVGSDDGKLYAIDANGELQWTFQTLGPIKSSPAVDGNGDIYFGSDDGSLYALYSDGSLKWKYQTAGMVRSSPVIGPDNKLYAGSEDGFLYCLGESTREDRERDIAIDVTLSLSSIENNGNPTTIFAKVTSDSSDANVLSRIASVAIDLAPLNLLGILSSGDPALGDIEIGPIGKERMLDDGLYEDDVAGDGIFTYAFGLTDAAELIGWEEGIYTHYPVEGVLGVGPFPLMITIADLYGNRTSKPFPLNIVYKMGGAPDYSDTVINRLNNQTLNISFTSGTPSIISIVPSQGNRGERVDVAILGKNTNFKKNKTKVEIFNDKDVLIAYALPESDDVDVLSDTQLNAVLNIIKDDPILGQLTGRWNVTVTTDSEVVVGKNLFEISSGTTAKIDSPAPDGMRNSAEQEVPCEFTLDVTNENGARPKGAPWKINTGYSSDLVIKNAQSGTWNFDITISTCDLNPSFKIITSGSNVGYLTGEVRDGITSKGIDNATITALTGEGLATAANSTVSSGGGYYLLPLSAAEANYTVTASKGAMIDLRREINIQDGMETQLNFSLKPEMGCPLTELTIRGKLLPFYQLRDRVLAQTPAGRRWVSLYYQHAQEVKRIFNSNPELKAHAAALVDKAAGEIPRILSRKKPCADLGAQVEKMLAMLIAKASPELKQALLSERENIGRFCKSKGMRDEY